MELGKAATGMTIPKGKGRDVAHRKTNFDKINFVAPALKHSNT